MTTAFRATTTSLLAASLMLALVACKPVDKDAAAAADADASPAAAVAIPGLKTEKQQVSYMIGMQLGQSLKPVKEEVDLDTVMRAVRTSLDDGELLMTEEQAMQVAQAFGERMQARQQAEAEALAKTNLTEGETFLAGNTGKPGVQTTASGLQYQVLTEGTGGKPAAGQTVRVHYKGDLLDGTTFDSSYERGEPAVFALNQVAPGWAEGVQLMPVGSKYKFWIPSKLGYGEQGTPGGPIGPNATLVFEVELLDIVEPGAAPAQ
ncbi:N/A [soil metagenome]